MRETHSSRYLKSDFQLSRTFFFCLHKLEEMTGYIAFSYKTTIQYNTMYVCTQSKGCFVFFRIRAKEETTNVRSRNIMECNLI